MGDVVSDSVQIEAFLMAFVTAVLFSFYYAVGVAGLIRATERKKPTGPLRTKRAAYLPTQPPKY
jgi:hypothetical protein